MSSKTYEVKVIKQIKYLPNTFLIRFHDGEIVKIIATYNDFINCEKEEGKLTKCFELKDGKLKETTALYSVPQDAIFSINSEKRIIKDEKQAKNIILTILANYGLIDQNLLITYNDYAIHAFNKFSKAQLYQFDKILGNENIEIYEVPPLKDEINFDFDFINILKINNHEIIFSNEVSTTELYAKPGKAYLIYTKDITEIVIKTLNDETNTFVSSPNKYYLVIYLEPKKEEN